MDRASLNAAELTEILLHPNTKASYAHIEEAQLESLRKMANLFQDRLNKPGANPRVEPTPRELETPRVDTPAPPGMA